MKERNLLLKAINRIVTDEDMRMRLMIAPREVLQTNLGISGENCGALLALLPVLLVGGVLVFGDGTPSDLPGILDGGWGGWGGHG